MPPRAARFAVVYLEDAPGGSTQSKPAYIENRQMAFAPFITVVPSGGKVVFSNADPFPHNVFSPDEAHFNIGLIQPNRAVSHVFSRPGAFTLLCNLHPNMLAYVLVTPSSYFARADNKGAFSIKDVPPGTYRVTAWAPRLSPMTQSVSVGQTDASIHFELHR